MKTKMYKKVFAFIFLSMLISFSINNIMWEYDNILYEINEVGLPENIEDLQSFTGQIDGFLTDHLVGGHYWNELYGSVHKALGKNEENNFTYVRDKNGFLYSGNFWNTSNVDARELALRVRRLQDAVADKGTKVVCIMYPTKYNEEWSDGYYGIPYNNLNEYADSVLLNMRRYNVDYIDFREVFLEADMSMEDIFYKTDHHWTVPTAFYSTGVVLEHLKEKYGDDLDSTGYYMDMNNYVVEKHEKIYLGSQGRETGVEYAGLDDYTYIYPKFDTKYTYSGYYRTGEPFTKHGDTLKSLVSQKYLTYEDAYEREMNNSYLQGICLGDKIVNKKKEDGAKMLFIRDSYSSPIAVFMAPMCSQIDLMWSLYVDEETVEERIAQEEYDYIFVALAIDNFVDEGFPFFKSEEENTTIQQKSKE